MKLFGQDVILLSAKDFETLCDAIENPKPPTEALRRLLVEAEDPHKLKPFTLKPVGAPGSSARLEQEEQIAAYKRFSELLAKIEDR